MKTSMTFKSIAAIALLGAALATPVMAQPGPGWGGGWGGGHGMGMGGMGWGGGHGMGSGRGMGWGGGPGMQNAAPAWTLMTAEEQTAFQIKMREVKTYDECKTTQDNQRKAMESRAKEKGVTFFAPPQFVCDNMKARGIIK